MSLTADLVAAWKSLRASRWTSVSAALILALGTGANVAVLAVAYAALWRPLPLHDADRLVVISLGERDDARPSGTVRTADLDRWRSGLRTMAGVAGWSTSEFTLRTPGGPEVAEVAVVTPEFFDVVGAPGVSGRVFTAGDAVGLGVASRTLGDRLGGAGQVTIGEAAIAVVGRLPADFPLPDSADLWVAAGSVDPVRLGTSDFRSFRMIGRLAPGVSLAQAQDDADRVMREVETERNRTGEMRVLVEPLADRLVGESRPVIAAFVAAAALLLLVACANVATLMVSRALARQRERAVRVALGASAARLLRTALAESLLLACAGGLAGAALAAWAIAALLPLVEGALPGHAAASLGVPAAAASVLVALAATAIAGAGPALAAARTEQASALRTATTAGSPGARRMRGALVVVQMAIAVVLLVGAGLLGRSVAHLLDTDLGIDPGETLALRLRLSDTAGFDAAAAAPKLAELTRRLRELPGVDAAGVGSSLPPTTAQLQFTIRVVLGDTVETRAFDIGSANPGYLEAIGARLVQGRLFEERDLIGGPVAVLTETAAKHLQGLGDPVGRPLAFGLPTPSGERVAPLVIGVVEDVRHQGLEAPAHGGLYVLWSQLPAGVTYVAVRTRLPAESLAPAVLRTLREVDPALPVPEVRTIADEVHRSILGREMRLALVGAFAAVAAALAIAGLAGALGRSVTERRREIAVRTALGATPGRTTALVLRDGALLSAGGLVLGLGAAALMSRGAASLVYGVSPYDTTTYAVVALGLWGLAFLAAWLPARRAARVNPLELLKGDG